MSGAQSTPLLSVLIKALNEETHIAACIEALLRETSGIDCEIVLADSLSTDRTVEIASRYPVKIVQLRRIEDRGAGAAAQLAYQFARGRYVYLIDGDMVVQPGFLGAALDELERRPGLGGVGGLLIDTCVRNMFDRGRVKKKPSATPGVVPWLNGGGVYRKAAVDEAGYLAHRFLPAYEEAELGMRLRGKGYQMVRLPVPAVQHTGHALSTGAMLVRHWRNGYARSEGMLLKSGLRHGYAKGALGISKQPLLLFGLLALALAGLAWWPLAAAAGALWLLVFLALLGKKRNPVDAAFSYFHWHYRLVAVANGLLHRLDSPYERIDAVCLEPGARADAGRERVAEVAR
ncbi:glycosyltransferase family 2 protein [Chitiniphilus eburneus]|nr:glycosyltransferase [Chitiniphilus eburneus]